MICRKHLLNAVLRLADSYADQPDTTRRDLVLAEGQQRDHQARLGAPFPHDAYRAELTGLRDQLKTGLSPSTPAPGAEVPPVAELAERIKALKAANSIEAAPERIGARSAARAEEPVTARIRRRTAAHEPEPTEAPSPLPDLVDPSRDIILPATFHPHAVAEHASRTRPESVGHDPARHTVVPMREHGGKENTLKTHEHAIAIHEDAAEEHASDVTIKRNGSQHMAIPRQRSRTEEPNQKDRAPDHEPSAHAAEVATDTPPPATPEITPQREQDAEAARTPTVTPDPRSLMSASLGEDGRMQLLRSHRFQQMQIRFDRQPDEKYLMMLKDAGWRDRTEEEGIWTRQVSKGEWKPVADAERLFKEIANGIRQDKGLAPVLQGLSVA